MYLWYMLSIWSFYPDKKIRPSIGTRDFPVLRIKVPNVGTIVSRRWQIPDNTLRQDYFEQSWLFVGIFHPKKISIPGIKIPHNISKIKRSRIDFFHRLGITFGASPWELENILDGRVYVRSGAWELNSAVFFISRFSYLGPRDFGILGIFHSRFFRDFQMLIPIPGFPEKIPFQSQLWLSV